VRLPTAATLQAAWRCRGSEESAPRPEGGRPGGGRYIDPRAKERLPHSKQRTDALNGQSLPPRSGEGTSAACPLDPAFGCRSLLGRPVWTSGDGIPAGSGPMLIRGARSHAPQEPDLAARLLEVKIDAGMGPKRRTSLDLRRMGRVSSQAAGADSGWTRRSA
jgi:hypothetical protein